VNVTALQAAVRLLDRICVTSGDGTSVESHDAGHAIVVEGRCTGTFKETGKSIDAQMCHVFRLRDGVVTRSWG
jgi:ketosteroid isomerase-like protein